MYRKTFKNTYLLLKDHLIFTIGVVVISFIIETSIYKLGSLGFGYILPPNLQLLALPILKFLLFPLTLGVIKCFYMAKYEDKKNLLYLFYFYSNFKRLLKSCLLGFIVAFFIPLSSLAISKVQLNINWVVILSTIFSIIVGIYVFLSSYIMVKLPQLSIWNILKQSFKNIKGNVNTLFFLLLLTVGLEKLFDRFITYGNLVFENNVTTIILMLVTTLVAYLVEKTVLFSFADIILEENS